ncbi:uncharacterized protein LOC132255389 [Phlebotomus argentipes]|uniref:uncharacterized protein LOC132255389 n=1 Tax=Phlebotomus argentipes TaxID=94469 RepID=UPI002892AB38|nr:uncharacterized protein LOC132255389 [Phlebotomus argentipes]
MDRILTTFFAFLLVAAAAAVRISELRVPATHVVDGDPLLLDCVYDLAPEETKLVVKWLLNEQAIYQWIPGSRPYPLNVMRNRLDEKFLTAGGPQAEHRALMVVSPTWNMTGEYTCIVDTFQSRAIKSAMLQIVVPPAALTVREKKEAESSGEEEVEVTCEADDAYPEPQLSLQFRNGETIRRIFGNVKRNDEGLYDVSVVGKVSRAKLSSPTPVDCVMTMPGSDYTMTRSTVVLASLTTTPGFDDLGGEFREENYDDRSFPSSSTSLKMYNVLMAFICCLCLLF